MKIRRILPAVLPLVLAVSVFAQEPDLSKVEIKTEKVSEGIYMLAGSGGNIGLAVGPDAVFMIDDEYAPLTPKIRAAVAKLSPKPIKFLLNTHWHGDHTGGNKDHGEAGTLIIAHENVRTRMNAGQFMALFNTQIPPAPQSALPGVTFTDSITFHLNGEEIRALHVPPAHTDGDSVIRFKNANVWHLGDLFFNGLYPFIDADSGGSVDGMIADAEKLLATMDAGSKLIPGHGPLASKADYQAFHDMLKTVRDRIAPMVKAGKSLKEVQDAKPTKEFDGTWGKGFLTPEQFVGLVYGCLNPKPASAAKTAGTAK
jgi:glyoxylase-like metal-dependent hydrolase (beta-lactamase superfamily II)